MFQSDFKEKSSDELELPGKKLRDVLEFLRCIYPNTYTQIDLDNARVILPLLEEYQVLQLKPRCEVVILETVTEETSTDDLLQLLKEACLYDLKALRARCIFLISSRPCDALDENYCKSFPSASALNEIFVHVNTSMKRKLAELEEDTKENELLKQYISSEIRTNKNFRCDPKKHWEQKTVVLTDQGLGDNCENEGIELNMWGVPLKVKTSESFGAQVHGMALFVDVKNVGPNKITCDVNLHSILVNRQPNGNNLVKLKKEL
ncbi:uncharacterized protein LOC132725863 [Ruditapes philippinarum]|uniref:uncharacterized protein LOC132725863 n=1 Tax=Ruditapes philippinarum TaxID=129788 RepID=UPI00295BA734|nr:uncharacterized protein LOC132725863 [Ruditapes philippinarum]